MRALRKALPAEDIVYLGDTARLPYGTKSGEVVEQFALENGQFLLTQQVKMILIACNSASAYAFQTLSEQLNVPVLGVIEPSCQKAVQVSEQGHIGVLATEATVSSGVYSSTLHRMKKGLDVRQQSCSLFVPLVEEGWVNHVVTSLVVEQYLQNFVETLDTLILGMHTLSAVNSSYSIICWKQCSYC